MRFVALLALCLSVVSLSAQSPRPFQADPPKACDSCAEWNRPMAPFKVFGNTYYVGTEGLSAMLVTSDVGHILLDGALPQSAPLIDASIRALGFRTEDVKFILNSHAHYDHAAGIAALQRASGATVVASAWSAEAIRRGVPLDDDPQIGFGREANSFPAVKTVREIKDGEVLRLGPLALTPHLIPGHTPGSTAWTWDACEPAASGTPKCLHMVYADSLTAVSAPGFRYTGDATHPSLVESFRASIAKLEALPCDIVVSTHPSFTAVAEKVKKRGATAPGAPGDPFVDPQGCRTLAADSTKRLDARVAEERAKP
jgi:metallo-beta-lactamase class B